MQCIITPVIRQYLHQEGSLDMEYNQLKALQMWTLQFYDTIVTKLKINQIFKHKFLLGKPQKHINLNTWNTS